MFPAVNDSSSSFPQINPPSDQGTSLVTEKTPVSPSEFYKALFQEQNDIIKGWIADGRLGEETIRSPSDRGESLLAYLGKNPKGQLSQDDGAIVDLINLVPQDMIDAVSDDGETPLIKFVRSNQSEAIINALLLRGANPNASDKDQCTVLMHCIKSSFSLDTVRYLCRHGVHLNARDNQGRTALHHVALQQNCMLVPELVAAGADKTIQDNDKKTAIDIAEDMAQDSNLGAGHDSPIATALKVSQADTLAVIGSLFGDEFRADLLKASTLSWGAIVNAMAYAMSVFYPANEIIETQNRSGRSYDDLERENEPVDAVVADVIPSATAQPALTQADNDVMPVDNDIAVASLAPESPAEPVISQPT